MSVFEASRLSGGFPGVFGVFDGFEGTVQALSLLDIMKGLCRHLTAFSELGIGRIGIYLVVRGCEWDEQRFSRDEYSSLRCEQCFSRLN